MPNRSRPFNERRPRRLERSRLLVVTEGTETEVQYLEGLVQFLRATGVAVRGVRPKGIGKDPLKVLEAAISINERDSDGFDEVYVIVDVDKHEMLDEALREGGRRSIPVVVSNPCFEIWLLWHYEDCFAHQEGKQIQSRLKQLGHDGKNVPLRFPFPAYEAALRRAAIREVAHTTKGPNPSSAMPHLLAALKPPTA